MEQHQIKCEQCLRRATPTHSLGWHWCKERSISYLLIYSPYDSQIEAIARLFQAEFDTGGIGGHLYAESLIQVLIVHLLQQYCAFTPKMQPDVGGMPNNRLQQVLDYISLIAIKR
ncbi:MAG: hypothetical protein HWQ40_10020 [Nostoc sp. NMS9]|nr:hypothetical protein [Nostoc sp. NMS9]